MGQTNPQALSGDILRRAAGGDQGAVKECLARYGGLLWGLARRFTSSAADAEDAVQEIFVDVWKSADRFDSTITSEAAFIAMIARRRLIDRRRREGRRPSTEPLPELPMHAATEPGGEVFAEAALARKALDKLRDEPRQILLLAIGQGLTYEEIAERTGLPLGTVKAHARRGLLRVREALLGKESPGEVLS